MICLKKSRFIIHLPNDREMLVITNNGWVGLTDFIKYFKSEYEADTVIRPVSFWQSFKFWIGGKYVNY